jgi:hypothetical protein
VGSQARAALLAGQCLIFDSGGIEAKILAVHDPAARRGFRSASVRLLGNGNGARSRTEAAAGKAEI